MTRIFIAAAACTAMLVSGIQSASARDQDDGSKTVTLQSIMRKSGYAMPDKADKGDRDDKSSLSAASGPYAQLVSKYAAQYGVPAELAQAVMRIESNFNPRARGSHGEIGLMQIKPATARMMGYSGSAKGLFDPETNIRYGIKYLAMAHELGGGETCGTILRYNAGHGATRMNPVSKRYCGKVQALLDA
jgi:soluble lytic murein transglycosylase-like protein